MSADELNSPAPTQVAQADETLAVWVPWDDNLQALAAQICLRSDHGYDTETLGACYVHLQAARAVLDSDWLAAHVATIRADAEQAAARALVEAANEIRAVREGGQAALRDRNVSGHPTSEFFEQWLRWRAEGQS